MIGHVMVEQSKSVNKIGITCIASGWIRLGYASRRLGTTIHRSETALAAVRAAVLTWLEPGKGIRDDDLVWSNLETGRLSSSTGAAPVAPTFPPISSPDAATGEQLDASITSAFYRCRPARDRRSRGRRRGDRRRGRPGGDLLARAQPGPEGHPRLGARLRRRRDAPGRARVGRARGDAVADHPGGGEDRPLRLRRDRPVLRRSDRARPADRQRGAVLGRRRHRHVDHGHLARRRSDLRPGLGRADRRMDPALLRHARGRQGRRLLRLRAERRLGRLRRAHRSPSSTRPRTSGCSTVRRHGRRTAASPTCTS